MDDKKVIKKKKKVSKKNKKSWIKHIDNKDVEEFLDQKRRDEALGFIEKKEVEELYSIDEDKNPTLSKKDKANLPLECYKYLINTCPIPDPVTKRNHVKSKEDRKCRIRKSIETAKAEKGILPFKTLQSQKDRAFTQRRKKLEKKELVFDKDIWTETPAKRIFGDDSDTSWIGENTVKHHASNIICTMPKKSKTSVIPAIEAPHPGISYNPSVKDHNELLNKVVQKETEILKEEAHVDRVTSAMFRKITPGEKEAQWIEEMSQGLAKEESEENEMAQPGPLSLNPPTSFVNKKTLKQRRKIKEQKEAALARKYAKVEKKKTADIYKLKFIETNITEKENEEKLQQEIRKKQSEENAGKTKRLSAKKFDEPELVFNHKNELRGNLRLLNKSGNILSDRFSSFQKRNMLAPSNKVTKFKKSKVKKFTKPSHRIEGVNFFTFMNKKKKSKKN